MSLTLNRLDAAHEPYKGYMVRYQLMCGECYVSISKTNPINKVTLDYWKSAFKANLQAASTWAHKTINDLEV